MKKIINTAFAYLIVGLASGVFFREFTKLNDFTGYSQVNVLHTHTLMLGMFMFMIVALFVAKFDMVKKKSFKVFYITYNLGLIMTLIMMSVRGVTQVLSIELAKGPNAAISGMSGLGHIIMSVGLVALFMTLRKVADNK